MTRLAWLLISKAQSRVAWLMRVLRALVCGGAAMKAAVVIIATVALSGCVSAPERQAPRQPILSCQDCSGLVYYGPAPAPAPDPRVQLAGTIVKGVLGVTGLITGYATSTEVASTIAEAGQTVIAHSSSTERSVEQTTTQAAPVVLDQPAPVVVQPEVVQPQVVQPEVVQPTGVGL